MMMIDDDDDFHTAQRDDGTRHTMPCLMLSGDRGGERREWIGRLSHGMPMPHDEMNTNE